jgi:hypothetical protein
MTCCGRGEGVYDLARMTRRYRALISAPITAQSDDDAMTKAVALAHSLTQPDSKVISGHLELLGEVREGLMEIVRVVDEDPLFTKQLPPDWKP